MSETAIQPTMPDGRPAPTVLTPEEACAFLRIKKNTLPQQLRTLKYYRDSGKLRGIRVGREYVYPVADLMKFLEGGGE